MVTFSMLIHSRFAALEVSFMIPSYLALGSVTNAYIFIQEGEKLEDEGKDNASDQLQSTNHRFTGKDEPPKWSNPNHH